ncbi:MAG: hydratase [Burkholderiaceae bacterium]
MPTDPREAAATIWHHMASGNTLDALPAAQRPSTRAEGYAIQARLPEVAGGLALRGWKIAATSDAGRAHIGVSAPLAGRIMAPYAHADGAIVPSKGNRMAVAEPEFAFVIGKTLAPRSRPYAVDEVMAAVSALRPAIEIPSSRFADFVNAGEPQLIADNACAGHFVFGPEADADWRSIDLRAHTVHADVRRDGRTALARDGAGENVLGDPRLALTWIANELSGLGVALDAGLAVSTGTCMAPVAIEPGDWIVADFGSIGRVSARFGPG